MLNIFRKKKENKDQNDDALIRKTFNENLLSTKNIPVNKWLPVIESEEEVTIPSVDVIGRRAIALCLVAVKGEGLEHEKVLELLDKYEIRDYLTPKESAFLVNDQPTQNDRIQFHWRYECYWVLLWALGYIDDLGEPTVICDVQKAVGFLSGRSSQQFIAEARLRSTKEILDMADLIFRYHWAVRDASIKGKEIPGNLDPGVVMERHYALNWLIGYMDQDWDDIGTDT
jgi:hypothetical protein